VISNSNPKVSLYEGLRWWTALQNGDHITVLQILSEERTRDISIFNYSSYCLECQAVIDEKPDDDKSAMSQIEVSLRAVVLVYINK
jgi:hypothetical protein